MVEVEAATAASVVTEVPLAAVVAAPAVVVEAF